ncbi:MAG: glycoside hydrolase family 127 protein, partial [Gorillibacterium sp.]|nr:glycoside hydrolase family 127 protein [Gorillibacterium sp.]
MQTMKYNNIFPSGDLYQRVIDNFHRLEREEYQPDQVYRPEPYDWPGDNEGRTILALVLAAQAGHSRPKYLEEILNRLPGWMNEQGYFGQIYPNGVTDEQQLSSNSWFLRGLAEHYTWMKDERSLNMLEQVVRNLLLPTKGRYDSYPLDPKDRVFEGEASGTLVGRQVKGWYLSTDIGCAFIMLDGATHAYELLQWPELKELIEEMISVFLGIDLIGISAQTHATLSATRGILRFHGMNKNDKYLDAAKRIYKLYKEQGMTENFANYNWFRRPQWTEPCAIVDSFLIAIQLWQLTGEAAYLEDAHNIYFNGIAHAQRENGGFGCDVCSGAETPHLHSFLYEAYWCCTMRGAEGLAWAVKSSYYVSDDSIITIPFYFDSTVRLQLPDGELLLKQSTTYPLRGQVMLDILHSTITEPKTIRLFVPSWAPADSVQLALNGQPQTAQMKDGFVDVVITSMQGEKVELTFDIPLL